MWCRFLKNHCNWLMRLFAVRKFGKIINQSVGKILFFQIFLILTPNQQTRVIAGNKMHWMCKKRNRLITKGLGNQQCSRAGNHYCDWYFSFSLPDIERKVVACALLIPASTWFITPVCCCVTQRRPTPAHTGVFPKIRANSNGWCRRRRRRRHWSFPIFCQRKTHRNKDSTVFSDFTYVLQPALAAATAVVVVSLIASLSRWNACSANILLTMTEINSPITQIHPLSKKISHKTVKTPSCVYWVRVHIFRDVYAKWLPGGREEIAFI